MNPKHERVIALRAEGKTVPEIATACGISQSGVYYYIGKSRHDVITLNGVTTPGTPSTPIVAVLSERERKLIFREAKQRKVPTEVMAGHLIRLALEQVGLR